MDKPVWVQYMQWLKGVLSGDFGWSGISAAPVADVFPLKLAATMELAAASGLVALFLGIFLGTFAGARRNRAPDHITRIVAVSGASLPQFWFGILFIDCFLGQPWYCANWPIRCNNFCLNSSSHRLIYHRCNTGRVSNRALGCCLASTPAGRHIRVWCHCDHCQDDAFCTRRRTSTRLRRCRSC